MSFYKKNEFFPFVLKISRFPTFKMSDLDDMRNSDPNDLRFDLIVDDVQEPELAMQEHELKMMTDSEYAEKINDEMLRIASINNFTPISDFKQLESNTTISDKICPHCKKEFSNKYTMKTHLNICNAVEREIVCGVVGCLFKTNNIVLFNQHKIVHKEARFICLICSERFKEDILLIYHKLTHKPSIYKCEICIKEFKYKSSFDRHNKDNHPKLL